MHYHELLVTSLTLSNVATFDTSSSVTKMHAASWHSDVHMYQCRYHRLAHAMELSVPLNALATRLQYHSTITLILTAHRARDRLSVMQRVLGPTQKQVESTHVTHTVKLTGSF